MRRKIWISSFVAVTAAAVGMELWAVLDRSKDTVPWTDLTVRFVPAAVTTAAVGWLVAWLPGHFRHVYSRQITDGGTVGRYAKFIVAAVGAGLVAAIPLYADGHLSGQDWLVTAAAAVSAVGVFLVPNKPAVPDAAQRLRADGLPR